MKKRIISFLVQLKLYRILTAFFLSLFVLGFALNPFLNKKLDISSPENCRVHQQLSARNDPNIFMPCFPANPNDFRIAWITDSSYQVLASTGENINSFKTIQFLYDLILERQPQVDGRDTHFLFYPFWGASMLDKYFGVLHALNQKPDFLIISLNPVWDFNSRAYFTLQNIPGAAVINARTLNSIKYITIFGNPGLFLWSGAKHISAFHMRYNLSQRLATLLSNLDFITKKDNASSEFLKTKKDPFETKFFMKYICLTWKNYFDPAKYPYSGILQAFTLRYIDVGPSSMPIRIFRDMLDIIKASGVKTYIYSIPFDVDRLRNIPELYGRYSEYENVMANLAGEYAHTNIKIDIIKPSRKLDGLKFYDLAHLTYADPFADYLVRNILEISAPKIDKRLIVHDR
jgi:hypothetical protein